MLSRAFTVKPRWSPSRRDGDGISCKLGSILEYSEDCLVVGFEDDLPLVFCGNNNESQLTLREVLRASVSVMGESRLGMTQKAVLLEGKIYAVKRFRKVRVGRREFGKRVERLSQVSQKCAYLVPVTAFLYSKRIKFVLCDYYPMGSLADLLSGGRELGHTALDWKQRLTIAIDIARAIAFIHTRHPPYEKNMQMNVHGNVKASNVMIKNNLTACLSDYGFAHLVESDEVSDTWQQKPPPQKQQESPYCNKCCQKSDIYNFGIILLDMLGGSTASGVVHCILDNKEEIRKGERKAEGYEGFGYSIGMCKQVTRRQTFNRTCFKGFGNVTIIKK
ncbi:probable inactive receptor kinase At3g08680 isoform X2 [Jatropha curcas]|uniref:probable inactive receptor kinase At3g08680 isoform X2 n=1 Tax=Jatropha curcas TaxID=180498 RepID=UPI0005FAC834|nr:probable inactive receptor kinase At3g08680 isoform X2 [Jatropha curcas]